MPFADPVAYHGPLFTFDPLDRAHPLAVGLVGQWTTLSPWDGGKAIYDLGGRYPATFSGALAWNRTLGGAAVSGFSTSLYAAMDAAAPKMTGFPLSIAAMVTLAANGSATIPIGFGNSGSIANLSLSLNSGAVANQASYNFSDGTTSTSATGTSLTFADSQPHVFQGISFAVNDHRLYLDGQQVATSTTTVTSPTFDRGTIGLLRRLTSVNPFQGKVIAAAAFAGTVPSPLGLARDWLPGTFAPARRLAARPIYAPTDPFPAGRRRTNRTLLCM